MVIDMFHISLLIIVLISVVAHLSCLNRDTRVKKVSEATFIEMMEHLQIDLVVIDNYGWFSDETSFIYQGWKFTCQMQSDHQYQDSVRVVGFTSESKKTE